MPSCSASRTPFSTAGMNWRGIDAADDVVDELEAACRAAAADTSSQAVAELAAAAGLLLQAALRLGACP